MYADINII